ncbi:MAG: hypothetical protein GY711_13885 [bacterium]|nr:hypothetical protein [bacterium]
MEVVPPVEEIFGTEFYCAVGVADDIASFAGTDETRVHITFSEAIEDLSDDALRVIAAHEVAHVHMRGFWQTLPRSIEEALADWVALQVVPTAREALSSTLVYTGEQTTMEGRVSHHMGIDGRYRNEFELIQQLGFERLKALAKEAHERGGTVTLDQLEAERQALTTLPSVGE